MKNSVNTGKFPSLKAMLNNLVDTIAYRDSGNAIALD